MQWRQSIQAVLQCRILILRPLWRHCLCDGKGRERTYGDFLYGILHCLLGYWWVQGRDIIEYKIQNENSV